MVQRRRSNNRTSNRKGGGQPYQPEVIKIPERAVPKVFGKSFILLEDVNKRTFEYKNGAWIPFELTIAQCRVECQVTELPQKVNRMSRYEVRRPIET